MNKTHQCTTCAHIEYCIFKSNDQYVSCNISNTPASACETCAHVDNCFFNSPLDIPMDYDDDCVEYTEYTEYEIDNELGCEEEYAD